MPRFRELLTIYQAIWAYCRCVLNGQPTGKTRDLGRFSNTVQLYGRDSNLFVSRSKQPDIRDCYLLRIGEAECSRLISRNLLSLVGSLLKHYSISDRQSVRQSCCQYRLMPGPNYSEPLAARHRLAHSDVWFTANSHIDLKRQPRRLTRHVFRLRCVVRVRLSLDFYDCAFTRAPGVTCCLRPVTYIHAKLHGEYGSRKESARF